jgi:purine nucleosidase
MRIIFDCDNTMGVKGCDVDDGLALLYLLGKENIEICGITTTYGNSDIDTVYNNTFEVLREIGRADIPLLKGCPNRYTLESQAVSFIVEAVNANPGNISILATGSLTNLYAAYIKDNTIFDKISKIVVMGGITKDLLINGKVLDELNFSCDPSATRWVIKEGKNLSVVTGNNCLDAFFRHTEFVKRLTVANSESGRYILDKCGYWFEDMMSTFSLNGFYNWDVVAAAYLANPQVFEDHYQFVSVDHKNVESGCLNLTPSKETSSEVNIPIIKDLQAFTEDIYNTWINVKF